MSETTWIIIASIFAICIAYGWAFRIGYERGCRDTALDEAVKKAEEKAREKFNDKA